jgi:hypothetical protein
MSVTLQVIQQCSCGTKPHWFRLRACDFVVCACVRVCVCVRAQRVYYACTCMMYTCKLPHESTVLVCSWRLGRRFRTWGWRLVLSLFLVFVQTSWRAESVGSRVSWAARLKDKKRRASHALRSRKGMRPQPIRIILIKSDFWAYSLSMSTSQSNLGQWSFVWAMQFIFVKPWWFVEALTGTRRYWKRGRTIRALCLGKTDL